MNSGRSADRITFVSADGESRLAARLDRPAGTPRAYALFAHCFTCGKDVLAASRIADGLTRHGIAVLRFDFTGLGGSEGEFENTDFSSNVADIVAAADWMREEAGAPAILIGHSLGGAAVLAAADSIPEAVAVCTIAAPAEPAHVAHLLAEARPELEAKGEAEVRIAGRTFRIRKQFLKDIETQSLERRIRVLRRALLVCHGPRDEVVGIDNATRIFTAAKHPKSFVSLDDADHLLSRRQDAEYVAGVIAAWADRYVEEVQPEPEPAEPPAIAAPPDSVAVWETRQGKFAQIVSVGDRHRLLADEPIAYGGTDTGPGPYDFLLAGLGACTTMTVRMYADQKGLPLERVSAVLRHDKIHAADCVDCETRDGKVDLIQRQITFDGPLDDAQRRRLLEIADKCPVHRTLHSEVRIETTLADRPERP